MTNWTLLNIIGLLFLKFLSQKNMESMTNPSFSNQLLKNEHNMQNQEYRTEIVQIL